MISVRLAWNWILRGTIHFTLWQLGSMAVRTALGAFVGNTENVIVSLAVFLATGALVQAIWGP